VSCAPAGKPCVAVGGSSPTPGSGSHLADAAGSPVVGGSRLAAAKTLIEVFNGKKWVPVPSPSVSGAAFGQALDAVSCASSTSCMAVGYFTDPNRRLETLTEELVGTRWVIRKSSNPSPTHSVLNGVSCPELEFCLAVGSQSGAISVTGAPLPAGGFSEEWNGKVWIPIPPPQNQPPGSVLDSVSCVAAEYCVAVGQHPVAGLVGLQATLAEWWLGPQRGWQVVPSANRSGATGNLLSAVSCTDGPFCIAAGVATLGRLGQRTLAERWTGKSFLPLETANRPGAISDTLDSVSCGTPSLCVATGATVTKGKTSTLVEHLVGAGFQVAPSPNRAGANVLDGVSCTRATCWAVGSWTANGIEHTLAEYSAK
jgi:hypothetical protein